MPSLLSPSNNATNVAVAPVISYGESAWSFTTASTGVAGTPVRFVPVTLGYEGTLAVYAPTGRQVVHSPFAASSSKAEALHLACRNLARGCYRYRFLRNLHEMDEGNFVVR